MKRQEMQQLLEERIQRITLLETRIDTMEQLIGGYRTREQAVIDTLRATQESAEKTKADALHGAQETLSQAKRSAEQTLASAEAEAAALKAEAQEKADGLLAAAKEESGKIHENAETAKRAFEEELASYNAALERSASQAQEAAAQFAAFAASRRVEPRHITRAQDLPDPEGDPAQLMRNIYRLQNRTIPDAAEPGCAQAEPEAEGAKPRAGMKESKAEVQRAFESMFAESGAQAEPPAGPAPETAPEPYSGEAWASEVHKSAGEPQAEFVQAFDTDFEKTDYAVNPDPACAAAAESAPETPAEETKPTAPEPEADEVKAAGLAFDELFPPEEAQAEENAKLDAAFEAAAADETHEWEPGAEAEKAPETDGAPKEGQDGGDVSLDDLLDEIINAGE